MAANNIPYLTVMYDQPQFREFVKLMLYYYGDWDLAQRKWSEILAEAYVYWRGLIPEERVITETVTQQTVLLTTHFHNGERYQHEPLWKRFLGIPFRRR